MSARGDGAGASGVAFIVSTVGSVAFVAAYVLDADPALIGTLAGMALIALGIGLVILANQTLPHQPHTEARTPLVADADVAADIDHTLELDGERVPDRRWLLGALATAAGALGLAALVPVGSLGPSPGSSLARTPWRPGRRAVGDHGDPVRADDVPVGGLVTVFPEGHPGSADGQVVLVRLPASARPAGGAADHGLIAFSKVCTHAGCPVGLYDPNRHELLCPCHQSAFDVLDGGAPTFGPAARALPRLPIRVDRDGFVVATGDFPEPIGPAYWNRP